jgi:uncharacterized protein YcsI (UPF0317 family)
VKNSGFSQPAFAGMRNSTTCPTAGSFDLGSPVNLGSTSDQAVFQTPIPKQENLEN